MAGKITVSTINDDTGVLATQNGMSGIAKSWVNFNGSTATIRASFNVSSVTRSSAGQWVVNMTTALADVNYSVVASAITSTTLGGFIGGVPVSSTQYTLSCYIPNSYSDTTYVCTAVFR